MNADQLWATAGIITAIGVAIPAVIGAVATVHGNRTIEQVHDAVRTSNGQTIGELVESNEIRRVDEDPTTTTHS
jgi:uncharacterized membrane protein YhiD involved in acid resistance